MSFFKKIYNALDYSQKIWLYVLISLFLISTLGLLTLFILNKTEVKPAQGGVIKLGLVGQPMSLQPILAKNETDQILSRLIFNDLVSLSSKIEPEKDNKTWLIRLKENLFWSNGKKITSDDVIFTISKIKEAEISSLYYDFWKNIEVQRNSELEITLKLPESYSFLPQILSNFFILPKHIFADVPVKNWYLSEYNLKPIASGPYKFKSINILKNGFISDLVLEINPYYTEQKPYIQEINIKFYPNKETLLRDFNNGQINVFEENDFKNITDLKIPHNQINFPISNYYAIFINQAQNLALKEKEVRQALNLLIDKNQLIQNVFYGNAKAINSPLPWIYNVDEEYNPKLASEILKKAGWELNENIYQKNVKNETIKLEFNLIVPSIDFLLSAAENIKNQLEKNGVKINIVSLPIDEILENNIKNRNYELILFGNLVYPNLNLYPFWHSSFMFWPGLNLSLYKNSDVDNTLYQIYTQGNYDEEKIKSLIKQITSDYPAIFLYTPEEILITSKNINNINPVLISYTNEIFKDIKSWYIKTKRVFK
jgi:peptide/nickel transport system substrate-binding protein